MSFLRAVVVWFNDPLNWRGVDGVPHRLLEHLALSVGALVLAAVLALPVAAWWGHRRRGGEVALNVANIGRAIPSFAVLVIGALWLGGQYGPALVALVLLAVPPIFTLTFTGLRGVDPAVVESARGMGLAGRQVLWRVELPVALPVVLAGLRLASASVLATATIAALAGGGGLGRYLVDGFAVHDQVRVVAGTVLVATLVVASEAAFSGLHRLAVSPGLRDSTRADRGRKQPRRSRRVSRRVPVPVEET